MIHILHTADLHLGKIIFEHSLIGDQKHVMNQLLEQACIKDSEADGFLYSALIISGDIYDRSIPPPEAVELFDDFLTLLHRKHPDLHIFIIPGNHDSAQRLSYASRILKKQNIHIDTSLSDIGTCTILKKGSEKLAVFQIPFLTPSFFNDEQKTGNQGMKSQSEILNSVMKKIRSKCMDIQTEEPLPCIASAHLFTLGAQPSDSERSFLGTAELIDAEIFAPFCFTALGHIHKPQKTGERVYYSGSPLAYSFSEAGIEKSFLHIGVDCTTLTQREGLPPLAAVEVTKIPVIPMHKASRLAGSFIDFYNDNKFDDYKDDYLEITFTDTSLIENPMQLLKTKFPFLLSINQSEALNKGALSASSISEGRKTALSGKKSLQDIFKTFVQDMYKEEESMEIIKELLPSFIDAAKEAQEGERSV
ncbi:MAG TPA: exonuclease SbcCD subunit D [Treponemataceae bacterium]|jgi:exonuclease SbcD|nr:exonuclease SbcCD subunit D [Treponemataceae bacterium]